MEPSTDNNVTGEMYAPVSGENIVTPCGCSGSSENEILKMNSLADNNVSGEMYVPISTENIVTPDMTLYPDLKGDEKIIIDNSGLKIEVNGEFLYAMHEAETNLSQCMAKLVTNNGGDILEIGFGIGASSEEIQKNNNVTSHTIIELNKDVYDKALIWAENKKNVEIILGDWIDVLPTINKKFDGILHDTWFDNNIEKFPDACKHISKINTILVFYYFPHSDLDGDDNYHKQNEKMFNVKEYQFSINEYERLPESYSYYNELYKDRVYTDLRYTVFDGDKFVKPSFTL